MQIWMRRTLLATTAGLILAAELLPPPLHAGGYRAPWEKETSVQKLAKKIDKLERHIDEFGTVVTKHPDVWGDGRLTKHRVDIENELKKEIPNFQFLLQGTVSETDSAFLGEALALNALAAGSGSALGGTNNPSPLSITNQMIPVSSNSVSATSQVDPQNLIIRSGQPTAPTFLNGTLAGNAPGMRGIGIEPTFYLAQKKHYLDYLSTLRRMNESDDTSDSPGYSLSLVRFPISVLPGRKTSHGYGAEITLTTTPYLSEQLLPDTVRGLVINDIIDNYGPFLLETLRSPVPKKNPTGVQMQSGSVESKLPDSDSVYRRSLEFAPTQTSTTSAASAASILQGKYLYNAFKPIFEKYGTNINRPDALANYLDIKLFLRDHLNTAYKMLATPAAAELWYQHCNDDLINDIRIGQTSSLEQRRTAFICDLKNAVLNQVLEEGDSQKLAKLQEELAWLIIYHSANINDLIRNDMQHIAKSKNCPCVCGDGVWFTGPNPPPEACAAFNEYVGCRWPVIVFALDPAIEEQNIGSAFSRRRELQLSAAIAASRGIISFQKLTRFVRRMELDVATIAVNRTQVAFSHGNDTFGWRFTPRLQPPPSNDSNLKVITQDLLIGGPSREEQLRHTKLEPGIRECTAVVLMPSFVPYVTFDSRADWFRVDNPDTHVHRAFSKLPKQARVMTMGDSVELSEEITELRMLTQQCVKDEHKYRDGEVYRLTRAVDQLERSLPLQSARVQFPYDGDLSPMDLFERGTLRLAPRLEGWYGQPGIQVNDRGYNGTKLVADLKAKYAGAVDAYHKAVLSDAADAAAKLAAIAPIKAAMDAAVADAKNPQNPGTTLFLVGKHFSLFNMRIIAGGVDVTDSAQLLNRNICQVTIPTSVSKVMETPDRAKPKDQKAMVDIHLATTYGLTSGLTVPVAPAPEAAATPKADATGTGIAPLSFSWQSNPEIHATVYVQGAKYLLDEEKFNILNANGPTQMGITFSIGGDAENAFGDDECCKKLRFAAFVKSKTDTTSKYGTRISRLDNELAVDKDQVTLDHETVKLLLSKVNFGVSTNSTVDYDLTGFVRFSDVSSRPTYKLDKPILLRVTFVQLLNEVQPVRESGTDSTSEPPPAVEPPPVPEDKPSDASSAAIPRLLTPGAKDVGTVHGKSASPIKPSRPVLQTHWSKMRGK